MTFDEAMGWSATHARQRTAPIDDPRASARLAEALRAFMAKASAHRKTATAGAPMPTAQLEAWNAMLDEVERFVAQPAKETSMLDTVRTRLQLETAFESDGAVYGDVPPEVAGRVTHGLRTLAVRLSTLAAAKQRRRPVTRFQWPLLPVVVTSPFGTRLHPIAGEYRFHSGIDLLAEPSQSIYAAEAGTVVFSGWNSGHGKQVEVHHDSHLTTRYSHLDALLVEEGQTVKRGELLGLAGMTGAATGVHLHFELRRDGDAIDPSSVLELPLDGPAVAGAQQ
ncbi:MAG: M23 family metallopeptidase [Archangium sp.]|nr:M23 family metallopeptidase [Archangium sp.]